MSRRFSARRAQAMIETVLAVLIVTAIFLALHLFLRMFSARILLDHAAARAARAKAVGFNDWMCLKSARVAMIPIAGKCLWPEYRGFDEASRIPIYMCTDNESIALGVLEYENWHRLGFEVGSELGLAPIATSRVKLDTDDYTMDGKNSVESHYPFYMYDTGL